jgi:hypothetical protein
MSAFSRNQFSADYTISMFVDQSRKPIGIMYARDALQNQLGEVEDDETLLRDYVMNVGYQ